MIQGQNLGVDLARRYFEEQPYTTSHWDVAFSQEGIDHVITIKICYDFEAGSKHLAFYVPANSFPDAMVAHLINNLSEIFVTGNNLEISAGLVGHSEEISSKNLVFTGRVFVWTPSIIAKDRWDYLRNQSENLGIKLIIRDGEYVKHRASFIAAPAFISHDSRNKKEFVKPLADELSRCLCPLWYDEFSLKPGDSLRETIEKGLKECGKCVIILSPEFFANDGWTRAEFNSIYTREIIQQERVIVPIWLNVTAREVYEYSPTLADRVGIPAALGVEDVAIKIMAALDFKSPRL